MISFILSFILIVSYMYLIDLRFMINKISHECKACAESGIIWLWNRLLHDWELRLGTLRYDYIKDYASKSFFDPFLNLPFWIRNHFYALPNPHFPSLLSALIFMMCWFQPFSDHMKNLIFCTTVFSTTNH